MAGCGMHRGGLRETEHSRQVGIQGSNDKGAGHHSYRCGRMFAERALLRTSVVGQQGAYLSEV